METFYSFLKFLILLLILFIKESSEISCKNEQNIDVDWFIIYKLPQINDLSPSTANLKKGSGYAFITSEDRGDKWKLSSNNVMSLSSILRRTWKSYANADSSDVSYLFYNDDAPGNITTSAVGHTKGIVAFDSKSGFWLRHSIPNFGKSFQYEFPSTALINGQVGLCITFPAQALNNISNHLLFTNPNIYLRHLSMKMVHLLDNKAKTLFTEKPAFVRKKPFEKSSMLTSLSNQKFLVVSKDNQKHVDIYRDILAPYLKAPMLAETWQRGAGRVISSSCQVDFPVVNIREIHMMPVNFKGNIHFKSTEDHSKWAITSDPQVQWVCIVDLNRVESQTRRGGGATCFNSPNVWKAFQSIIYETNQCGT